MFRPVSASLARELSEEHQKVLAQLASALWWRVYGTLTKMTPTMQKRSIPDRAQVPKPHPMSEHPHATPHASPSTMSAEKDMNENMDEENK
jgi:hypothetical protein